MLPISANSLPLPLNSVARVQGTSSPASSSEGELLRDEAGEDMTCSSGVKNSAMTVPSAQRSMANGS